MKIHGAIKSTGAVVIGGILAGSLYAQLSIPTDLNNAVQTIKEIRITSDGTDKGTPVVRINGQNAEAALMVSGSISMGTITGAQTNKVTGDRSSILGGQQNEINGNSSVIAGGKSNKILGAGVFIGGGENNIVNNSGSIINGGKDNTITGSYSTIAGGEKNKINSNYSFAAGKNTQVNHQGTFVWSDNSGWYQGFPPKATTFTSQKDYTFLIRAQNGVGINTNNPGTGYALDVNGNLRVDGNSAFDGNQIITGEVKIYPSSKNALTVFGKTFFHGIGNTFYGPVDFTTGVKFNGVVTIPQGLAVGKTEKESKYILDILGDSRINGELTVTNNTTIGNELSVKNNAGIGGNLIVAGKTQLLGNVEIGAYAQAIGTNSVAMGLGNANGKISTAMGLGNANGNRSTAMGDSTTASGTASTAMGSRTFANGEDSVAMGLFSTANGDTSTAIGNLTQANGNASIAMGYNTQAIENNSTSMGYFTIANGLNSTALGQYNIGLKTSLFEIGNGDYTQRKNIVTVTSSDVKIGGAIKIEDFAAACDGSTRGTIKFANDLCFYGCNGTSWTKLGTCGSPLAQ